ncbi:MAG: quinone-dependent dihydroorotate dehydrogenase [Alphaproteobacteria bacterium]|nr:quinone-dependent dihydroorotate dehydrogenase [Alphaproteobacteria bacterium]
MSALHQITTAALRCLPAETAHGLALQGLAAGFGPRERADDFPSLAQSLMGMSFANPVAVSAGFDKNALAVTGVRRLGTGFVEVGGVTPRPQPGNPRPRVFRLAEDRAAINRLGFNNDGAQAVHARLAALDMGGTPLGVNLAANGDSAEPADDFVALVERFAPVADFLTVDISCPNSSNGQVFLDPQALEGLLARLNAARDASGARPAMFGKLSPDIDDTRLAELIAVMRAAGIDAITVCNTTTERPASLQSAHAGERGGLSGAPLFEMANEMLRKVYAMTGGEVPLVGVGGIMSGADAWTKIRAGASLVQLYTGMVYEGPGLVQAIKRHLAQELERGGHANIADAVGSEHR